jgi:hypothetical protein
MEHSRFNELSKSMQDEILTLINKIASHPTTDSITIVKEAQEKIVEQFFDRQRKLTLMNKIASQNQDTHTMKTYKLRAEVYSDIDGFITFMKEVKLIPMKNVIIDKRGCELNCELTFTTNISINEIKRLLRCFPDTHVMRETLAPIDEYTGDDTEYDSEDEDDSE